jgi:hypothetical protein
MFSWGIKSIDGAAFDQHTDDNCLTRHHFTICIAITVSSTEAPTAISNVDVGTAAELSCGDPLPFTALESAGSCLGGFGVPLAPPVFFAFTGLEAAELADNASTCDCNAAMSLAAFCAARLAAVRSFIKSPCACVASVRAVFNCARHPTTCQHTQQTTPTTCSMSTATAPQTYERVLTALRSAAAAFSASSLAFTAAVR